MKYFVIYHDVQKFEEKAEPFLLLEYLIHSFSLECMIYDIFPSSSFLAFGKEKNMENFVNKKKETSRKKDEMFVDEM